MNPGLPAPPVRRPSAPEIALKSPVFPERLRAPKATPAAAGYGGAHRKLSVQVSGSAISISWVQRMPGISPALDQRRP
jgi:hypothetical protein